LCIQAQYCPIRHDDALTELLGWLRTAPTFGPFLLPVASPPLAHPRVGPSRRSGSPSSAAAACQSSYQRCRPAGLLGHSGRRQRGTFRAPVNDSRRGGRGFCRAASLIRARTTPCGHSKPWLSCATPAGVRRAWPVRRKMARMRARGTMRGRARRRSAVGPRASVAASVSKEVRGVALPVKDG
jgi:hypothetical protein